MIRRHIVSRNVSSSARGMADHTPVTPQNTGRTKRKIVINPNVRRKDIAADIFPFDNAVKKAEPKILQPENRKPNEKSETPVLVISKTVLLFPANSSAI